MDHTPRWISPRLKGVNDGGAPDELGALPIHQIDIVRNQEFLLTRHNLQRDASFEFTDAQPSSGEHYYYVRAQQVDGQLAWSSPIWVTRDR